MDIDSSNFDPKRYVLTMLKQNTIKQLIRKNNEIDEEIKVQDHQIQSLVFQNYSKFISSIDTVRQMKDNICMVDDKLKVLDQSMDKISDLALKIDQTFKFKRKQIQKLDTVNKDLQKLRNLCDFPNVLKQDLAQYKSIHQSKLSQSFSDTPKLFNKSIAVYQQCYKTLQQLKSQSLIEPIYKQSLNKIEELRSILRTRQVQYSKEHTNSNSLRIITKYLLIISDPQNQVSVLRSYFHSWKDRLILKRKINKIQSNQKYDKTINLSELLNSSVALETNQQFWTQFLKQFAFVYQEVYQRLAPTDQISLLVNNHTKQLFNWAIVNQLEEIPLYSSSIKSYVHANHIISGNLKLALSKIKIDGGILQDQKNIKDIKGLKQSKDLEQIKDKNSKDVHQKSILRNKVYNQLSNILKDKMLSIGQTMLNFIFGRLKIAFMQQIGESKKSIASLTISQELLKQSYIKVLGPIKQNFKINFEPVLDDLEHLNSSHQHIFQSKDQYDLGIHTQIDGLIRFLGMAISLKPETITQQLFFIINKSTKLHKLEKTFIENAVKQFSQVQENGPWFVVAHNYLNYLNNNLGKKIIQSAHKRIEASQNYNYAGVFTFIKQKIGTNLLNLVSHYSGKIGIKPEPETIFESIHQFIEIVNSVFPDSRRAILKKPSFLSERGSYFHETEIMSAKKLRIIDKLLVQQRSYILTIFIRRLLKSLLIFLRTAQNFKIIKNSDIYCVIQVCYELGNVEQQTQISAFYYLFCQNLFQNETDTQSKEQLQNSYLQLRKKYIQNGSA